MPWMKKYGRTWSMRAARKASLTTMQQRVAAVREQLCRLRQHRKELLRRIHDGQRQLDCLDYLIYQVKRGKP